MSSNTTSIQAPYTIAHIPQPLDPIDGKTFISDVHSLVGSRKRKRNEIAIATDGESVNVYDIQSPRLKTSYALSPQSKFTCPPCCIHIKQRRSVATQRYAYCSVLDSKPRIQLFSENVGKPVARPPLSTGAVAGSVSHSIPKSSHPIVHLDIVPSQDFMEDSKGAFDILAVHQDGELRCLSSDLDAERWRTKIGPLIAANLEAQLSTIDLQVEYAMLIDAETAGKGLLKERADLRAMLGAELTTGVASCNATMLFLITRWKEVGLVSTTRRSFHMFSIRGGQSYSGSGVLMNMTPPLQHMQSATLPESANAASVSQLGLQFMLHSSSGTLYQNSENGLGIYDLSRTLPKLSSHIHLDQESATSFLRLSSSSVLSASPTSITVYDTRYRSARAIHPVGTSKKKSKSAPSQGPLFQLLSYFSNLGLVLALNEGSDLLALQITLPSSGLGGNRKRKRNGLLIDSIGRGMKNPITHFNVLGGLPRPLGNYLLSSRALNDQPWREQMAKLDSYVTQSRVDLFEDLIAQELGIADKGPLSASRGQEGKSLGKAQEQRNNHWIQASSPSTNHEEKIFKSPGDRLHPDRQLSGTHVEYAPIDRHKVLYVLSRMFSWAATEEQRESNSNHGVDAASRLRIVFFPPNIFYWLVDSGNISSSHVELALRHKAHSITSPTLSPGALTEALLVYDPSLRAIMSILEGPVYLDAIELAHVVKLLLRTLEAKELIDRKLLTNGDGHYVDGKYEDSQQCDAAIERDDVSLARKDQLTGHRRSFIAALKKIHSFPGSTITKALRKELTGADTISLIHQLRMELAEGAWTSRYVDGEILPQVYHYDHGEALGMISDLFSCAVDCIGMGGWVLGTLALDDPEEREDMIAYMKAEVSAVLEGLQEATYLGGLLGEMLLYRKSVAMGPRATLPTAIDTKTCLKPISMPLAASDTYMLPLSLKAPKNISMTKVGAGGEIQKRSKRDIGRLKSKMVGKYSRERIAI